MFNNLCVANRRNRTGSHITRPARMTIASALAAMIASVVAVTPAAAARPDVFTEVRHFEHSQYFPPDPNCEVATVGTTEIAVGTEHFHITDLGDSFHIVYGETFKITMVYDDGSPNDYRQGTDAFTLQVAKDGDEVVHESFHDFGPPFGNLQFFTTFVVVNGEVLIDHNFGRNLPYC